SRGTASTGQTLPPNPPFNRSVVSLWSSGKRLPSLAQIARIKAFNRIDDHELQVPQPEQIVLLARCETIVWIRQQWFRGEGPEPEPLTPEQLQALDHFVDVAISQAFQTDKLAILEEIRKTYPKAEIWRIDDLNRLLDYWLDSHAGLEDVLIDEDFSHES
ncbi:MAG: hypothetical protein ACKO5E_09860, partial [bacterium]